MQRQISVLCPDWSATGAHGSEHAETKRRRRAPKSDFVIEEPTPEESPVITTTSTTTTHIPASSSAMRSPSSYPSASTSPPIMNWSDAPAAGFASSTSSPSPHQHIEFASPPGTGLNERLDNDNDDDAPLRFRRVDNVLGSAPTPGFAERELEKHLLLASDMMKSRRCWRRRYTMSAGAMQC